MRIIGGSAGGRTLKAPPGKATRPTSDRVREALFSILGPPPDNALVLDLFAGSGGLGLEAISRGAQRAIFVDQNNAALKTLQQNIRELGMAKQAEVVRGDSQKQLQRLARSAMRFHWIFIDPPYASDLASQSLQQLGESNILDEEGIVVVEHDRRHPSDEAYGFLVKTDTRRYGDTCISFYETKRD